MRLCTLCLGECWPWLPPICDSSCESHHRPSHHPEAAGDMKPLVWSETVLAADKGEGRGYEAQLKESPACPEHHATHCRMRTWPAC